MSGIEYQKIELHSTQNLAKDHEIIEYEREAVQKLMLENQIKFSLEIEEADLMGSNYRKTGTAYVLNLIVRKDDAEKVIELLDKEGGFGYVVDLDETYDPDAEENHNSQDDAFLELPNELKEEEQESIETVDNQNDDPIKIYGRDDGNITIEFKALNIENFGQFMMKLFVLFTGIAIFSVQAWLLACAINELNYKMVTTIFVAMVLEVPCFIFFYNVLNKKKGK